MLARTESSPQRRRRALRDVVAFGVCGGLLVAGLKLAEYRFLVVERSVEIYAALVAALIRVNYSCRQN